VGACQRVAVGATDRAGDVECGHGGREVDDYRPFLADGGQVARQDVPVLDLSAPRARYGSGHCECATDDERLAGILPVVVRRCGAVRRCLCCVHGQIHGGPRDAVVGLRQVAVGDLSLDADPAQGELDVLRPLDQAVGDQEVGNLRVACQQAVFRGQGKVGLSDPFGENEDEFVAAIITRQGLPRAVAGGRKGGAGDPIVFLVHDRPAQAQGGGVNEWVEGKFALLPHRRQVGGAYLVVQRLAAPVAGDG